VRVGTYGSFDSDTLALSTPGVTGVVDEEDVRDSVLPAEFALYQNYPNPFNPTTEIRFSVPPSAGRDGQGASWVRLVVYDLLGRQVATLVDETRSAGVHSVLFDARGQASGVYICRMTATRIPFAGSEEGFTDTRKLALVR
jgi:hypothetical protein